MSLQQLEAVRKIKEIRRYSCRYQCLVYQSSLHKIEAEMIVNREKRSNEIKLRKAYEDSAYGELETCGASMSRLSQIRNEIKSMLTNEKAIEAYQKSIEKVYDLNKRELQKTKDEFLVIEQKLEGVSEFNAVAVKAAALKDEHDIQDDNDDFAIVKYIKKS